MAHVVFFVSNDVAKLNQISLFNSVSSQKKGSHIGRGFRRMLWTRKRNFPGECTFWSFSACVLLFLHIHVGGSDPEDLLGKIAQQVL